jgi:hypothetical protein
MWVFGLAHVGGLAAGFATLSISKYELTLKSPLAGVFGFESSEVVSLEVKGSRLSGRGLHIRHTRMDYPKTVTFFPIFRRRDKLIAQINQTGFVPSGSESDVPVRDGLPVKWQAIVIPLVLWNLLIFVQWRLSGPKPGLFSMLPIALILVGSLAVLKSRSLQSAVLKKGRSVGEIRPILRFFVFLSALMLWFMSDFFR